MEQKIAVKEQKIAVKDSFIAQIAMLLVVLMVDN